MGEPARTARLLTQDIIVHPCQKVYNFARFCRSPFRAFDERCNAEQILGHITRLAEKLDYEFIKDGDFYSLVGKNDEAWTAAEVAPKFIAADLVNYSYRGLGGDLEAKRCKLTSFLRELEPHRKDLEHLSSSFTNDLFFLANNINIRHNNTTQHNNTNSKSKNYNSKVSSMGKWELEKLYDKVHRMCVAAFLLLAYGDDKEWVDSLKC